MYPIASIHRELADRIPTEFERLDDRFARVNGDEWIERPFRGGRWLEGPVYYPAGKYVLFNDIPNDRTLRHDTTNGITSLFAPTSGHANGSTLDRTGRRISCEQSGRRVVRHEHDGSTTVLADSYRSRRLNSPNDVVVRSDGTVWFTDPSYGIDSDYEGLSATREIDGCHVYRIDLDGTVVKVADDFERPNGLAFSVDESILYIVDTRRRHIRAFDVHDDGGLTGGRVLNECAAGSYDGIRVDTDGRIWAAAGDGVHCIAPDGTLLGKLLIPEIASNLCFAGPQLNHLFVTASSTLYTLRVNFRGVR